MTQLSDLEYHEPPEVKTDEPAVNGLMCFLDGARECGADCMAFMHEPPTDPQGFGPQQSNCVLLVSAERTGRYLAGLVSLTKKGQADKIRTSHAPPPDPRGNKP